MELPKELQDRTRDLTERMRANSAMGEAVTKLIDDWKTESDLLVDLGGALKLELIAWAKVNDPEKYEFFTRMEEQLFNSDGSPKASPSFRVDKEPTKA